MQINFIHMTFVNFVWLASTTTLCYFWHFYVFCFSADLGGGNWLEAL